MRSRELPMQQVHKGFPSRKTTTMLGPTCRMRWHCLRSRPWTGVGWVRKTPCSLRSLDRCLVELPVKTSTTCRCRCLHHHFDRINSTTTNPPDCPHYPASKGCLVVSVHLQGALVVGSVVRNRCRWGWDWLLNDWPRRSER